MTSTILVAALLFGLLAASILLWVLFLRLGLHWANIRDVTARRLLWATVLVFVLQVAITAVSYLVLPSDPMLALALAIGELAVSVLMPSVVVACVFKASFFRALLAWLPTLLAAFVMVPFIILVFNPYLAETFVTPTNSMAPTLLGDHWTGTCAECGSPAYCSPETRPNRSPYSRPDSFPDPPLMICRDNFHISQPADYGDQVFGRDRFVVVKFFRPRRWDLVMFRYPEEPSILYVKRLVGLPGERITIKDGRVWADGEMLTPPDSLRGINYASEMAHWPMKLWGSPEHPAKLRDDEYFVLGDFSPRARDSRMWENGAPGHNPFAVPKSHLCGVVTHIFWPPQRWRTFR